MMTPGGVCADLICLAKKGGESHIQGLDYLLSYNLPLFFASCLLDQYIHFNTPTLALSLGHWCNSLRMTQRRYSLSSSFFPPFLSIPRPEHARCLATGFLSLLTQVRGCNPWPGNESLSQYVLPPHLINPYLAQTLCGC